ncbi:MAG TPA: hypothetical protein PLQ35_11410 [bacterium]|nr:hypothetical protein [bacterium]HQL62890.1 hypothetical protein [bacterium]
MNISRGSLWGLSQALLARYRAIIPLVEEQGTGAAYLDLSGLESLYREPARERVRRIVESVSREMNVGLRAGLARNKVLAYLAACHALPGQVFELDMERESVFLESLPLRCLPGMEDGIVRLLSDYGVETVGEFGGLPEEMAVRLVGPRARQFLGWARGEDDRPVQPGRSEGMEHHASITFPTDTSDYGTIADAAYRLVDRSLFDIRQQFKKVGRVRVCVTHRDRRKSRASERLKQATGFYPELHRIVERLLQRVLTRRVRVHALEITLADLEPDDPQILLFSRGEEKLAGLCRALDAVWFKHGRILEFADTPALRNARQSETGVF